MGTSVRVPLWLRLDQPANASDHPFWNLKSKRSQISDLKSNLRTEIRSQISDLKSEISLLRDSSARVVAATGHGALDRPSAVAARRRARRRIREGAFRLCLWR